jgi:hypothetical protein
MALSNTLYFGMAVCSHAPTQNALVQFRDLGNVSNAVVVAAISNPMEALGPSSRKTPIAITEIMYKPAPRADSNNLEFVEIYNSNPWFHDISGYRLVADKLSYTFPRERSCQVGHSWSSPLRPKASRTFMESM